MADTTTPTMQKPPKDRSPSFPFISLKAAVQRLTEFEKKFGRHPTPADKVGLAWGMKEKSSQAFQTLAALKAFGFVAYEGPVGKRSAVLTDLARTYLRAQQDHIKQEVLKKAALLPKEMAKYWARWSSDRPIDEVCLDDLILTNGYTESAAATFLKVYDTTIAFAGLRDSDKVKEVNGSEETEVDLEAEDNLPPDPPAPNLAKVKIMPGERELLSGLLAKDVNFRVIVNGHIGVKEIENLIRKLEIDKDILADQDDEKPAVS